jgi:hypothetical protein
MARKILVCETHKKAIFLKSIANTAPRWTGRPGDPPEQRQEIGGQDDLKSFKKDHRKCKKIRVSLV